jgi:hypothetical protein
MMHTIQQTLDDYDNEEGKREAILAVLECWLFSTKRMKVSAVLHSVVKVSKVTGLMTKETSWGMGILFCFFSSQV